MTSSSSSSSSIHHQGNTHHHHHHGELKSSKPSQQSQITQPRNQYELKNVAILGLNNESEFESTTQRAYHRILLAIPQILYQYTGYTPAQVRLIGNGFGWINHVVVQLFLSKTFKELHLLTPTTFRTSPTIGTPSSFIITSSVLTLSHQLPPLPPSSLVGSNHDENDGIYMDCMNDGMNNDFHHSHSSSSSSSTMSPYLSIHWPHFCELPGYNESHYEFAKWLQGATSISSSTSTSSSSSASFSSTRHSTIQRPSIYGQHQTLVEIQQCLQQGASIQYKHGSTLEEITSELITLADVIILFSAPGKTTSIRSHQQGGDETSSSTLPPKMMKAQMIEVCVDKIDNFLTTQQLMPPPPPRYISTSTSVRPTPYYPRLSSLSNSFSAVQSFC